MFQKALPRGEQQKAAELLGVDAGLVSRWASGAVKPTTANRMAIQSQYGVPWDAWDDDAPVAEALAEAAPERVVELDADQLQDAIADDESSSRSGPNLVNPPGAPSSNPPPNDEEKPASVRLPKHGKPIPTPDPDGAI